MWYSNFEIEIWLEFSKFKNTLWYQVWFFLGKFVPYSHTSSSLSIFTALIKPFWPYLGQFYVHNDPKLRLGTHENFQTPTKVSNAVLKVASRIWAPIFFTGAQTRTRDPALSTCPKKSFENFRHHKVKTWHYWIVYATVM